MSNNADGSSSNDGKLEDYKQKRDFERSEEPDGGSSEGARGAARDRPLFVIQKHDASTLHYDIRLEVDGVLKSWAVPKGPSTDPSDKRLAVETEDHPFDYADFEGVIPKDDYGGGTVLIWDRGSYENITEKNGEIRAMNDALEAGHVLVRLNGEKISGGYALQRIEADEGQWLLIKMDDDEADARRNPVSTEPASVVTDRDLEAVARDEGESE